MNLTVKPSGKPEVTPAHLKPGQFGADSDGDLWHRSVVDNHLYVLGRPQCDPSFQLWKAQRPEHASSRTITLLAPGTEITITVTE